MNGDIARCNNSNCGYKENCRRWLERNSSGSGGFLAIVDWKNCEYMIIEEKHEK